MKKRRSLRVSSTNIYVTTLKVICVVGAALVLLSDVMSMM